MAGRHVWTVSCRRAVTLPVILSPSWPLVFSGLVLPGYCADKKDLSECGPEWWALSSKPMSGGSCLTSQRDASNSSHRHRAGVCPAGTVERTLNVPCRTRSYAPHPIVLNASHVISPTAAGHYCVGTSFESALPSSTRVGCHAGICVLDGIPGGQRGTPTAGLPHRGHQLDIQVFAAVAQSCTCVGPCAIMSWFLCDSLQGSGTKK